MGYSAQLQDLAKTLPRQQCHERKIDTILEHFGSQSEPSMLSETPNEPASDKISSRAAAPGRARANSAANAGCDDHFLRHSSITGQPRLQPEMVIAPRDAVLPPLEQLAQFNDILRFLKDKSSGSLVVVEERESKSNEWCRSMLSETHNEPPVTTASNRISSRSGLASSAKGSAKEKDLKNHHTQSLPMPAGIEKRRGSSANKTGLQVPLPTSRSSTSGISLSSRTSQKSSQASSQASHKVRVSGYNLLLADFVEKERRLCSLSRFDRAGLEQINERVAAAKVTLWQNTYIVVTITLIPICFLVGCLVLVIVLDDTLPTS